MLRSIPTSAHATAIDGVLIRGSALEVAQRAASIDTYARKKAAAVVAQAQESARAREREASQAGFAAGYAQAMQGFVDYAAGIDEVRTALCKDVLAHAKSSLQAHCASIDFNAEWIERWCNIHVREATWSLKVSIPADMRDLFDRLQMLAGKDVVLELGAVDVITLEHGPLIHEFIPDAAIFESQTLQDILGAATVMENIRALADDYMNTLKTGEI